MKKVIKKITPVVLSACIACSAVPMLPQTEVNAAGSSVQETITQMFEQEEMNLKETNLKETGNEGNTSIHADEFTKDEQGSGWKWTQATKTLELEDATITSSGNVGIVLPDKAVLSLKGSNSIVMQPGEDNKSSVTGILAKGDFTITKEETAGSITINTTNVAPSENADSFNKGITAGNITLENDVSVLCAAGDASYESIAIQAQNMTVQDECIMIAIAGNVSEEGGSSIAIALNTLNVNNGAIYAKAGENGTRKQSITVAAQPSLAKNVYAKIVLDKEALDAVWNESKKTYVDGEGNAATDLLINKVIAEMDNVTLSGKQKVPMESKKVWVNMVTTLREDFATSDQIKVNNDITSWFTNLPEGVKAVISALDFSADRSRNRFEITFSGTPMKEIEKTPLQFTIPAGVVKSCEGDALDCVINTNATIEVAKADQYALNIAAGEGGTVTPAGITNVEYLDTLEVSAKANLGYEFDGWYDEENNKVSGETTYVMTAEKNETLTAKFKKLPQELTGIVITKAPEKTVYNAGETFYNAGMTVIASYSDGTSKEVTDYTVSPNGKLKEGTTSVEISYTENGVTKKASQKITVKHVHSYSVWITKTKATAAKAGVQERFCFGCGEKQTRTIAKLSALTLGQNVAQGNYNYEVTNARTNGSGTVMVTGFAKGKSAKTVSIPKTISYHGVSYKVTKIAEKAFINNSKISSVVIKDNSNLKTIGEKAFKNCKNLKTVKIGESVTRIESYTFYRAQKLSSVTIGENVKYLGEHMFCLDKKLKSIVVKTEKLKKSTIGQHLFYHVSGKITVPFDQYNSYSKIFKGTMKEKELKYTIVSSK